jgi:hypothetical protein
MNAIVMIRPYKTEGLWAFDDAAVGLVREPFVDSANILIDQMVKDIPDAENGFVLLFSASRFPGAQMELSWSREEFGGNWYRAEGFSEDAWLCPALFRYFSETPAHLYGQFKARAG